jgi:hypothetical protein
MTDLILLRKKMRVRAHRLMVRELTLRMLSVGFRLEMLRLRFLITILKLPDYLSALLVTIFRGYLRNSGR